ncbi:MAG: DUF2461 domain-containing protein [Rudaea sp.]
MATTYFSAKAFALLREFARNNNREWFAVNRPRFEALLRDPFLALIGDLAAPLAKISPHFRADPRPHGGSMFRIYRDARFSKDKSPYKTWLGARLQHERGRQLHAPTFYLHIQPKDSFVGGGLWHPEPPTLARVRDFLVANPATWKKAVHNKRFATTFQIGGDVLSRPPRGYDAAHALIDDIKRKDFAAWRTFGDREACSSELRDIVVSGFKGVAPMIDYLCAALDLEF